MADASDSTDQGLQEQVTAYLSAQSGVYGVALMNTRTNQTVLVNADHLFLSASTYKVLVMYCVYRQIASGTLKPDSQVTITDDDADEGDPDGGVYPGQTVTVATALDRMITISSNNAAHALVRTVGGWTSILQAASALGMPNTSLNSDDYFVTTPSDMLAFFAALSQRRLVSAQASDEMLKLLERQTVNDRIPAQLPAGAAVAHKTGELPGIRNDVGVVLAPSTQFVICVFGQDDEDTAVDVISHVARMAYDHYAQVPAGKASASQ
jgi:beta-lactamase class A